MSRLQVGNLAMYIPTGDTVTLVAYLGVEADFDGKLWDNVWHIKSNKFMVTNDTNNLTMEGMCSAQYLMPLGDEESKKKFEKEKELEIV